MKMMIVIEFAINERWYEERSQPGVTYADTSEVLKRSTTLKNVELVENRKKVGA